MGKIWMAGKRGVDSRWVGKNSLNVKKCVKKFWNKRKISILGDTYFGRSLKVSKQEEAFRWVTLSYTKSQILEQGAAMKKSTYLGCWEDGHLLF